MAARDEPELSGRSTAKRQTKEITMSERAGRSAPPQPASDDVAAKIGMHDIIVRARQTQCCDPIIDGVLGSLIKAAEASAEFYRETLQMVLDLLNPLHGSLDLQVTEQFTDERELDPPSDREYAVNVTWQMERDLTQAVTILENRIRYESPPAAAHPPG